MLTLLKQARAYGVGCVLATQNPVDLDYKGLGNTGTWLIGRLQTERDRDRLLDGLTTALAGGGPDRAQLATMLGSLTQRVFLMRNVHDDAPVLLKSRWALSYLRGPLTPAEIGRLMAPRKSAAGNGLRNGAAATAAPPEAAAAATIAATAARPALPAEIQEAFVPVRGSRDHITYQPRAFAVAKLHFVDRSLDLDEWQQIGLVAPLSDDGGEAIWEESEAGDVTTLAREAVANSAYADLPAGALRAASYTRWSKDLSSYLYEHRRLTLSQCDELKLRSRPGESEGDFRSRIALTLREKRDARTAELRNQYAARLAALQARLQKAAERTDRERGQLTQQKLQTAISVGATVLGALLGRKAMSTANIGRATTAARSASRIGRESDDVQRAEDSVEQLNEQIAALNKECESAVADLDATLDPRSVGLRTISAVPRKADIAVGKVVLLWTPWRSGSDGMPANAS
jgi:hypothetical protein